MSNHRTRTGFIAALSPVILGGGMVAAMHSDAYAAAATSDLPGINNSLLERQAADLRRAADEANRHNAALTNRLRHNVMPRGIAKRDGAGTVPAIPGDVRPLTVQRNFSFGDPATLQGRARFVLTNEARTGELDIRGELNAAGTVLNQSQELARLTARASTNNGIRADVALYVLGQSSALWQQQVQRNIGNRFDRNFPLASRRVAKTFNLFNRAIEISARAGVSANMRFRFEHGPVPGATGPSIKLAATPGFIARGYGGIRVNLDGLMARLPPAIRSVINIQNLGHFGIDGNLELVKLTVPGSAQIEIRQPTATTFTIADKLAVRTKGRMLKGFLRVYFQAGRDLGTFLRGLGQPTFFEHKIVDYPGFSLDQTLLDVSANPQLRQWSTGAPTSSETNGAGGTPPPATTTTGTGGSTTAPPSTTSTPPGPTLPETPAVTTPVSTTPEPTQPVSGTPTSTPEQLNESPPPASTEAPTGVVAAPTTTTTSEPPAPPAPTVAPETPSGTAPADTSTPTGTSPAPVETSTPASTGEPATITPPPAPEVPATATAAPTSAPPAPTVVAPSPNSDGPPPPAGDNAPPPNDEEVETAVTSINSGLTSYWNFNGNSNDSAGHSNAMPQGGPAFVPGKFGQGMAFGVNRYAKATGVNFGRGDFTISLWVNFNGNVRTRFPFLAIGNLSLERGPGYTLELRAPRQPVLRSRGVFMLPNRWNHVVVRKHGNHFTFWLNGRMYGSVNRNLRFTPGDVLFGRRSERVRWFMPGRLDDVGLWNRAVTDAEIRTLFDANRGQPIVATAAARAGGPEKAQGACARAKALKAFPAVFSKLVARGVCKR